MPELTNTHAFAVPVLALGRELAPFETIVVEDEKIVRDAIATGVLHSDMEKLDETAQKLVDDAKTVGAEVVATWHREHGNPHLADPAVPDADDRETPFVSTAQVNHIEGQALGDAQIRAREQGVIPAPDLSQDHVDDADGSAPPDSATPPVSPKVERRAGPTDVKGPDSPDLPVEDAVVTPDVAPAETDSK